jgi:hypothetical protein
VGLRPLTCWDCGFESRRADGCLCLVSGVCCWQVEVSAPCRSLIQRSPTECGVSECDRKASTMRKPWPTGGLLRLKKKKILRHMFETEDGCEFTMTMLSSYIVTPVCCNKWARVEVPHHGCLAVIDTSNSGDKPSIANTKIPCTFTQTYFILLLLICILRVLLSHNFIFFRFYFLSMYIWCYSCLMM